jgi:hypothetical protein
MGRATSNVENSFGISLLLFMGPHYLYCCGKLNSIQQPASEFGVARQIAYQKNEERRGALKPYLHQSVFSIAQITPELAQELQRRHDTKLKAGHICQAP